MTEEESQKKHIHEMYDMYKEDKNDEDDEDEEESESDDDDIQDDFIDWPIDFQSEILKAKKKAA